MCIFFVYLLKNTDGVKNEALFRFLTKNIKLVRGSGLIDIDMMIHIDWHPIFLRCIFNLDKVS